MVSLKLQKRLAASVLKCGKKRVWLDPAEIAEISTVNSRAGVRRLVRDGFVIRRPVRMHSRARVRRVHAAKRKGRHTGVGTRKGTHEARMPSQLLWRARIRVQRRLLRAYRASGRIDRHQYHVLYARAKGNVFRNKRVLIEAVHRVVLEQERSAARLASVLQQKRAAEARRSAHKAAAAAAAAAPVEKKSTEVLKSTKAANHLRALPEVKEKEKLRASK